MYFNSVFYIFGITLVLVQCRVQGGNNYHEFKIVECRDVRKEMAETLRMSEPRPRNVPIELLQSKSGEMFMPRTVYMPRCTGVCPLGATPVPTKTTRRVVPLVLTSAYGYAAKCATIELEEHTNCRCECTKNPSDCDKETQFLDENTCSCICKNEQQQKHLCKNNMYWDRDTCSCQCSYGSQECAANWRWSKEECSCVRDPTSTSCRW